MIGRQGMDLAVDDRDNAYRQHAAVDSDHRSAAAWAPSHKHSILM